MRMLPSTSSLEACALWAGPRPSPRQAAKTSKLKKRLHGACGQWTDSGPARVQGRRPSHALVSSRLTRRHLRCPGCPPLRCSMSRMKIHASATCGVQTSPSWVGKLPIVVVAPSSQMCGPCHIVRPGGPMSSADHSCTCKVHRDA